MVTEPNMSFSVALLSALRLSLAISSYNFTNISLPLSLRSCILCWGVFGRHLQNWWMVDVLKHSSPNKVDLSPNLMMDFRVFSKPRYQAAALLGSVLLVSSERVWVAFRVLRWKYKCSNEALYVFFLIFSTEVLKAESSRVPTSGRLVSTSIVRSS